MCSNACRQKDTDFITTSITFVGYSSGGLLAFETARCLHEQLLPVARDRSHAGDLVAGLRVESIVLLESFVNCSTLGQGRESMALHLDDVWRSILHNVCREDESLWAAIKTQGRHDSFETFQTIHSWSTEKRQAWFRELFESKSAKTLPNVETLLQLAQYYAEVDMWHHSLSGREHLQASQSQVFQLYTDTCPLWTTPLQAVEQVADSDQSAVSVSPMRDDSADGARTISAATSNSRPHGGWRSIVGTDGRAHMRHNGGDHKSMLDAPHATALLDLLVDLQKKK